MTSTPFFISYKTAPAVTNDEFVLTINWCSKSGNANNGTEVSFFNTSKAFYKITFQYNFVVVEKAA